MHRLPDRLPDEPHLSVAKVLNAVLADGLDLHSQIKVAQWNVKGPHFAKLHPLFESLAAALAGYNDQVAERAVTLGARVQGTARQVAGTSRLADLPADTVRDRDLAELLADRIETYLDAAKDARGIASKQGDRHTVDLLTGLVEEFGSSASSLRARPGAVTTRPRRASR